MGTQGRSWCTVNKNLIHVWDEVAHVRRSWRIFCRTVNEREVSTCRSLIIRVMPTKSESSESEVSSDPDWRDKQIVQDIEDNNADPAHTTLLLLTYWNKHVYGDNKNTKDKTSRKFWSNKLVVSYCTRLSL